MHTYTYSKPAVPFYPAAVQPHSRLGRNPTTRLFTVYITNAEPLTFIHASGIVEVQDLHTLIVLLLFLNPALMSIMIMKCSIRPNDF